MTFISSEYFIYYKNNRVHVAFTKIIHPEGASEGNPDACCSPVRADSVPIF